MNKKTTEEIAAEILIAAIGKIPSPTVPGPVHFAEQIGKAFTVLHRHIDDSIRQKDSHD